MFYCEHYQGADSQTYLYTKVSYCIQKQLSQEDKFTLKYIKGQMHKPKCKCIKYIVVILIINVLTYKLKQNNSGNLLMLKTN